MDRELVPVGFSLANRKYDYKVPKELEAGVRRLASEIKDRFLELKTNFNFEDDTDVLANILFQLILKMVEDEKERSADELSDAISGIDRQIDDYIAANIDLK